MKCPQCHGDITHLSRECGLCGYVYDPLTYAKLAFYFDLKNDLTNLKRAQDNAQTNLEQVSIKIRNYEEILKNDLANLAGAGTYKEEAKPVPGPVPVPPTIPDVGKQKGTAPGQAKDTPPTVTSNLQSPRESKTLDFEIRLGLKWLPIIGIVTMVFGIGYFLKFSFERGWVGPAGRVAMAYFWGAVLLMAGNLFRKRNFELFGLYLIGGGIAVLYFSAFAAFQIYHLFNQTPSFLMMILITVLATVLSILYNTKWLAILGMIGGFLTPVLLSTGEDHQIALMTYMTILNLGLLGVAFYKKWDLLSTLGFVFTYLLYSGWFFNHYAESKFWPAILYLNIFYFIYSIIPFAYQFFRVHSDKLKGFMIITPNSFIAFGFSYFMIKEHFSLQWVSVVTILYSLVFLLMAYFLFRTGRHQQEAFVVLLAKSALFLIITVPIIFSEHWITIFWAAQAIALLWMGIKLDRHSLIHASYLLFAVTLAKFLLYDYTAVFGIRPEGFYIQDYYTYLLGERYITSIFLLLILYTFACMARNASLHSLSLRGPSGVQDSSVLFGVWGFLFFVILNVETASSFYDYLLVARFAAISVLWTLFSVSLMVQGFIDDQVVLRKVSLGLFSITLVKVFFFDMARFSTPYRIISFIVLGVVLIATSYLYYRYYRFKEPTTSAIGLGVQKEERS